MGNSLDSPFNSDYSVELEECLEKEKYNIDQVVDSESECNAQIVQEALGQGISRLYKRPRCKTYPEYQSRLKGNPLEELKTEAEEAIEKCKKRKRDGENDLPPHKKAIINVKKSVQRCWMCRKTFIEAGGNLEGDCICGTNVCHICGVPCTGYFSIVDHLSCRDSLEPCSKHPKVESITASPVVPNTTTAHDC